MADNDDLIQYLQNLAGGKGPATEATMTGIAKSLGVAVSDGNTLVTANKGAMSSMTNAIGKSVAALGNITKFLGNASETVVDFSKEQRKASQVMKDFTSILGPLAGLGKMASALIGVLDDNQKSFNSLSSSGIYAGKQFNRLSADAAALGIDLGKFTGNLQSAGGDIARLGGAGGLAYVIEQSRTAFDQNAESLAIFGYNFEETNEKFMSFLNQNSLAMRMYGKENVNLTRGAKDYSVFLRRLAELTGDQVDEAEDQIKKARANNIFNVFMQTIKDPQTRAKYDKIVATYGQMYGEQGREYAMSVIAGFQPMTKGAQQIGAMVQGLDSDLRKHKQFASDSAQTTEDFSKNMFGDVVSRTRQLSDQFGGGMTQTALAASMSGSELDGAFQSIYGAILKGTKSQEEIDAMFAERVGDEEGNLKQMAKINKRIQELRSAVAEELAFLLSSSETMNQVLTDFSNVLGVFIASTKGFLSEGATTTQQQSEGKPNKKESDQNKPGLGITDEDSAVTSTLKVIASYLLDIKGNTATMFGNEDMGLTKPDVNTMIRDLATNPEAFNSNEKLLKLMQSYQDEGLADSPEAAQKMIVDSLKLFIQQNMPTDARSGLLGTLTKNQDKIKLYNKGTLGHGSLFGNFGAGQLAMLHGEEAVIPKNSPIGGMLSMMQGDLGNLKESAFKDGKMNIGGMIESATKMGAKYDSYAKENSNAINDQGRGMVKSMTGMSDEQLDKMSQSSVQSNTSTSSAPAVNSMGGGKLDELIRINKQMLTELRNM